MRNVRPLHWCVMALVFGCLLLGTVYLTTGGAGGLSLGALFLLGGALLYLLYRLQQEVRELKSLLAVLIYRNQPLGGGDVRYARDVSSLYNTGSN